MNAKQLDQTLSIKEKLKQTKSATPCEIDKMTFELNHDVDLEELANLKELGHARIPVTCTTKSDRIFVDQACGEQPGLVYGDYAIVKFRSKGINRTLTTVTLRGLDGMQIAELKREKIKTWKFCLFQALVALLAKTQLR